MFYEFIFTKLGFSFKSDLKLKSLIFDKNNTLTDRLRKSVFYYKSPNNTNTSFYLITTVLSDDEIEEVRRYIWNKNDADLIFYYPSEGADLEMFYAKYSPSITNNESRLDTFLTSQKDLDKIEKIKHWQFDSGVFWFNYSKYIDKSKYKGIDKELVSTLETLKKELDKVLYSLIVDEKERNEKVQALIDRTLYIKYLEDNHIINSHFYEHYFNDKALNYEKLLESNSDADLNKLFKKIHAIFNNSLFEHPTIDNKYLNKNVRTLIANSFNTNLVTGQLKLFHFQFDVLPVEFISYIYEVFLSEKQKENGIYYTPKKLAQLIVDEVINEDKIGSILDPSCGSGMFLIVGYQRLLEIARKKGLEPENSIEKIEYRTKLLSDNIFGIEKELTAQRFTLFSLSLQIFKDINPKDIKDFIALELKQNKKINLFSKFSFFKNIKYANTLNDKERPFADKKFSYLVGNPPFFEIPNNEEYKTEITFLNSYKVVLENEKEVKAKEIVGKSQISQCFFIRIKDWSDKNTRFGFVSNSSNFYNDYSKNFQNYFYSNFGIERIYELSRVKKILFEKAKESVVALIFSNEYNNNTISYYPIDLGLFSEKPFELLIIQEDKVIPILQKKLIDDELRLRDFLIGNEHDLSLIKKISDNNYLEDYIKQTNNSKRGIQIWGEEAAFKEFNISLVEWRKLSKSQKEVLKNKFYNKYIRDKRGDEFNNELYKPKNLNKFQLNRPSIFFNTLENFDKVRTEDVFIGNKILWNRIGKLKAVFSSHKIFFDFDIYSIELEDSSLYYLITAILNSNLIEYYINIHLRKRLSSSFPKIGLKEINRLPIPKNYDKYLEKQISELSKRLTEGVYEYIDKESELNNLVYELYDLSYWEKQRVEDYFLPKERIGKKRTALSRYKSTLNELLEFYFKNSIVIEENSTEFNLKVIKISLNNNSNTPKANKTKKYILNEIFEQNPNENFLASQEKIYGKDCVYIIKEDINKNWTETKAFEDGQELLKHLIPNEDGKRIY